jgi:hypothetical protein
MLYAFLCYNNEATVYSWTKEEDDAVMSKLDVVHQKLVKEGRFGPALRLMPTTTGATLHKEKDLVLDGPYAETKEALRLRQPRSRTVDRARTRRRQSRWCLRG